jgi:hypothetical protein
MICPLPLPFFCCSRPSSAVQTELVAVPVKDQP